MTSCNRAATHATQEIQKWALLQSSDLNEMQQYLNSGEKTTYQKTDKTGSKAHQGTVVPEKQNKNQVKWN